MEVTQYRGVTVDVVQMTVFLLVDSGYAEDVATYCSGIDPGDSKPRGRRCRRRSGTECPLPAIYK